MLAAQLKSWNYDVTEAQNGAEAWDAFREGSFSLVLTDWMMPDVDGIELIRRIREAELSEYVYIVLLTSRTEKEDLVQAMDTGADDFLGKPCDPNELRVRLRAGERIINLEHALIDQNRELKETQAALVQSAKLAGVGQLAAGMAHEINNPIAFVSNNLAVVERDIQGVISLNERYEQCLTLIENADAELASQLRMAQDECDLPWLKENLPQLFRSSRDGLTRVRRIVGNLRDFAHLDEAQFDQMDVVAAMESTLEVLNTDLESKQIQLQTTFPDRPLVQCQPAKIKQVFHSILRNAIQASPDGGCIEVSVRDQTTVVSIEIIDHGDGMGEVTQQKLFEPFYTTRAVGDGQGLGLAISYGIVKQHDGSIEFSSEPEHGTSFRVILPVGQPVL